jgi:hypothetical protein
MLAGRLRRKKNRRKKSGMKKIFETIILPVFGVIGTLITLITFIYPNFTSEKISISTFVVMLFLMLMIITVLGKIIIDYRLSAKVKMTFNNFRIKPLQFVEKENVILIQKEIDLPLNLLVSIYIKDGLYEKQIAFGYVYYKQDEFTQVKLVLDNVSDKIDELLKDRQILNNIIIRPSVYKQNRLGSINGGAK